MGISAGISALGTLGSGFMTSNAAGNAAATQAAAAQQALALQQQIYGDTRRSTQSYRTLGGNAAGMLNSRLNALAQPFDPTESMLQRTPGYQFNLSQGLKSTQNSAAARGLGLSGAALKGASAFATGLADNTLQTQFNIDQANKSNAYNKLLGAAGLGEQAAIGTGQIGASTGSSMANTLLTGAQGQSAAQLAQGTAYNPLLNNLGSYYQMSKMGGGLYGSGS